jgi:hypothetical protein
LELLSRLIQIKLISDRYNKYIGMSANYLGGAIKSGLLQLFYINQNPSLALWFYIKTAATNHSLLREIQSGLYSRSVKMAGTSWPITSSIPNGCAGLL